MEWPSWGEIGPEATVIPDAHNLRPEAKQLLRRMRVPLARLPGATDIDYIDWLDMIVQMSLFECEDHDDNA
jgi:hypothetical protein